MKRGDIRGLLVDYVLGTLEAEDTRTVAAALANSPALAREAAELEEAFAGAAQRLAEAPPAGLRERLRITLAGPRRFLPFHAELALEFDLDSDEVLELCARIDDPNEWEEWDLYPDPKIRVIHFEPGRGVAPGADAGLVRVAAGASFPRHRHLGSEMNLILEGALHDGDRIYNPGSVVRYELGSEHGYRAGSQRTLVLASLHGGLVLV